MPNFAWWQFSLSFMYSYYFQWPWLYFKVTAVSNSFNWKFCVLIRLNWNLVRLLMTSSKLWIYHYFWFSHMFKGDDWRISWFQKKKKIFNVGFFSDAVKARSFKLCMIIILLRVYIVILGSMTLTLLQGHRFVRNIKRNLHVLDSCPL